MNKKEMSADAKAEMTAVVEKQSDWTACCRKCKVQLSGTLQEIRDHKCDSES